MKETFLAQILMYVKIGTKIEEAYREALAGQYTMFKFNDSVYSTALYFFVKDDNPHSAILFNWHDLI